MFKALALGLLMAAGLALLPTAGLAQEIHVSQLPNGRPGEIEISLAKTGRQVGLLELVDDQGVVIRTLAAGKLTNGRNVLRVAPGVEVPQGDYTLRYREGLGLKQEMRIPRPDHPDGKWTNPGDIRIHDNKIYIHDVGMDTNEATLKQTGIVRLNIDGTPDNTFGTNAVSHIGFRRNEVTGMSIDPEGQIYISNGYHSTEVFDPKGKSTQRYIAGWNHEPFGPLSTGWINSHAIGEGNKIYLPTSYGNIKVYDRTKNVFEGALFFQPLPGNLGRGRAIASIQDRVYIVNQHHQIERYTDTGNALKSEYVTDTQDRVAHPGGIHIVDRLLWVCATGPGWGPYWDSEGGGEIVLYFDDCASLKVADRFGFPGNAPDRLEFMHPSAVVSDKQNKNIWVVENGMTYAGAPEGSPPGNAQVRKFNVTAEKTVEVKVNLKKPAGRKESK